MRTYYQAMDIVCILVHTGLISFNLTGWAWRRLRKLNLFTLLLTAASWFGLGVWYGIGYCPLTDWHWRVRAHLGEGDLPASYLKYWADRATGLDVNPTAVDTVAVIFFAAALIMSATLNIRDWRGARQPVD
ncbi:MAG: DUF2784 domain-containing protein [Candidatus Hydrogenedentes bacterium]|nr:DUF2784 domain-containing protein [Candidatus Hydrogenedentota bacterium]